MKTYIIICAFADKIAGGPIYNANKVRYMKEKGWNVVVVRTDVGTRAAIPGLEEYFKNFLPEAGYIPTEFTKCQREKLLKILLSYVPCNAGETVIETGNDYTAYWGELLAERIGARHIVIFLDEQNPFVNARTIQFFKFKYERHEMACISKEVMQALFKKAGINLSLEQCYGLPCNCTNSLDDYDSSITDKIPSGDYNIGYVGRLEKPFLPAILDAFETFILENADKTIALTFFGAAFDKETERQITKRFCAFPNVRLLITGYIYPLPVKALHKISLFVSGAGSANVACKAGCYSLKVNVLSYQPDGIITSTTPIRTVKNPKCKSILDYMNWILKDGRNLPPRPEVDYEHDWEKVEQNFDLHLEFLSKVAPKLEYFDLRDIRLSWQQKVKRLLRTVLGIKGYNFLHNLARS